MSSKSLPHLYDNAIELETNASNVAVAVIRKTLIKINAQSLSQFDWPKRHVQEVLGRNNPNHPTSASPNKKENTRNGKIES